MVLAWKFVIHLISSLSREYEESTNTGVLLYYSFVCLVEID